MTSRNPSPISACDVRILRVVLFDSTQTQGSSKYFLFKQKKLCILEQKKCHLTNIAGNPLFGVEVGGSRAKLLMINN